MASKVNEIVAGKYDHKGESVVYGDTDSVYFTAHKTLQKEIDEGVIPWTKDSVVALYDKISDEVNGSFKAFMTKGFHCPSTRGEVIKAGRELVLPKRTVYNKEEIRSALL